MSKFGKFMAFFGVKFGLTDLLCVKHLTLCNSVRVIRKAGVAGELVPERQLFSG